jgi:outer membrane protein assembly factor BamA
VLDLIERPRRRRVGAPRRCPPPPWASLLLVAALLCSALPLQAQEGRTVGAVKIEGLPAGIANPVKSLGLSAGSGLLGGGKPVFRRSALDADRQRLRLLLARHGYPYALIEADVRSDSRGRRVDVVFRVRPGRPVRVAAVRVEGAPPDLVRPVAVVAPVLGVGRVFADDGVRDAHDRLALALARSGYALAEVHSRVERPDSFSVVPVFDVTAGGVQRFGSLTVEGLPEDLEDLALKTLGVPAGGGG